MLFFTAFWTFSKARTSIWRTRARHAEFVGEFLQRVRLVGRPPRPEDAALGCCAVYRRNSRPFGPNVIYSARQIGSGGSHSMNNVRDWLRKHNFEQYADAFEANDVGLDILPELNESDLEQLGVSLGNRRRLLKAIAEHTPELETSEPSGEAERRQVTVLFCDMVGSTALSGTLDPELLGQLIRRYQDAAAGAIGRFGGFVAKFMGDGVLAYFGFPRAFEDAAESAVRAAIGILAEVGDIALPDGTRMQARVGIATGLVVVGEIVGTGSAQERTIVGETPNLAARLQALAAPDTILISEATQNLLGGLFELQRTGPYELKGFARPVPVWRVAGEATVESRFAASRAGDKLPLIGRAHEMGLLLDRWRLAQSGEGQIVTLIGEAGIGKSRAVEALQEALAGEPHRRIHLQCSPYYSDSSLFPVIKQLSRAAGFAADDSPGARIDKLRALFARRVASDPLAIPLLADLLSIADPSHAVPASLNPAQRKAATIALLVDEIVGFGDTNPVLLIVEDAHWIDATTLELMTRLTDNIGRARLLVLVTARPDFAPPWQTRPHSTLLTLGRLGRADCARLVAGVAAAHGVSAETVAAIVAKTDGVPLFVEELTKSVIESTGEDSAAVPATLKDSLMARLDRLGEAREVAQIAAVVGRQFPLAILDAVVPGAARRSKPRWPVWSPPASCFRRAAVWSGVSASSMRCCATPPMRACCWRVGANGMSAPPARSSSAFPNWRRASRKCWPIISVRPV